MIRPPVAVALVLLACAPRYEGAGSPPGGGGNQGATVVGRIDPEGHMVADTLSRAVEDTARADRETVYSGFLTPAAAPAGAVPRAAGPWRVQAYAARDRAAADRVARDLEAALNAPASVDPSAGWHRVRVGGYATRAEAEALRRRVVGRGFADAYVVRAP